MVVLTPPADGIALVTINRPEVLNATNARLHLELTKIWLDLADDPRIRVIIGVFLAPLFFFSSSFSYGISCANIGGCGTVFLVGVHDQL